MTRNSAQRKLLAKAANGSSTASPSADPVTEQLHSKQGAEAQTTHIEKKTRDQRMADLVKGLRKMTGTCTDEIAQRIVIQVSTGLALPKPEIGKDHKLLMLAVAALKEMAPQNATEALLATQMIAVHEAALLFLCRAKDGQRYDAIDSDAVRAMRLMRVFVEQLEAMQRLKGKSRQQKVTVEHVHIHRGGQAIVGAVTTGGQGEGVGDEVANQGDTP